MATKAKPKETTPKPNPLDGLTEGRMTHYVLPDERNAGEHRPAIIVQVWDYEAGTSNLVVFCDGDNDGMGSLILWRPSVRHSEDKEPGTWHWIEAA